MNFIPALASIWNSPLVIASLVAAPVVYLGLLAFGRWLKRAQLVPLGATYPLLALALAAYAPLKALFVTQRQPAPDDRGAWAWQDWAIFHFEMALVLLGVLFSLALLKRYYWQRWWEHTHHAAAPKFLQQIFGFAVFTVAIGLVAKWGYGREVNALVAGSGIAAIVLGFAMQETLANIVSGIALQIGKPFKIGDWLILETQTSTIRAEVMELNWRSTRLRTNDDVYLDIPNKAITAGTITNLSLPTKVHSNRIHVHFEYSAPPNVVREILRRSASAVDGVLTQPPVKVFLRDFHDSGMLYEIKYSLEDERRFNDIEDAIRTNIWYDTKRAGLTIPFPVRTLKIERQRKGDDHALEKARELLRRQEMLAPLSEEQQEQLLTHFNSQRFGRGEHIIRQGEEGSSMYIILDGEVDVSVDAHGSHLHVATLREGEAFGEMSMLTGEPRSANVIARNDCDVWELRRPAMQALIQEDKALIDRMSELLARRKMQTEGIIASSTPLPVVEKQHKEIKGSFIRKLSALFEV